MRHLRASTYTAMAWKNGGGHTREIATCSDSAGLLWRLSLADVTADGPYSRFPGMRRILTVTTGAGTRLMDTRSGNSQTALPLRPASFDGDQAIRGELINGPVQNFNVIYDPLRVSACVHLIDRAIDEAVPTGGRRALYCLCGPLEVTGSRRLRLQPGDTAMATGPDRLRIGLGTGGAGLHVTLDLLAMET
ncbi:MAG: HutD family protein [Rhodospirillales bacterium]|nr:HutD family protein [Rhodospirillales bacterium]